MLTIEQIQQVRFECFKEPFSASVPVFKHQDTIKIFIYEYQEDIGEDVAVASLVLEKLSEMVYEVASAVAHDSFKGSGKILYYFAMNCIYPRCITPSGEGISIQAKRLYNSFEWIGYVQSFPLDAELCGHDCLPDENEIINRKYCFQFPKLNQSQ